MPELLKRERFTRPPDYGCPLLYRMGQHAVTLRDGVSRQLTTELCYPYAGLLYGPRHAANGNFGYARITYCLGVVTVPLSMAEPRARHFWERNPEQWDSPSRHRIWWWKLCYSA